MSPKLNVGLFAIGLDVYWSQFEGLKQRLLSNLTRVATIVDMDNINLVNGGMVDNIDKAFDAGDRFRSESVDIILIYVSTYALSATVLPVVQRCKVPVIILNLVESKRIEYNTFNNLGDRTKMTGEWLAYCNACPVPELMNVFYRCGIVAFEVVGVLDKEDKCYDEIQEWLQAAYTKKSMSYNRLGLMGHYYGGMLDIYTDLTKQYAVFGGHIEHIEVEELVGHIESVTDIEFQKKLNDFSEFFDITKECKKEDLALSAKTAVALDKLVRQYKLGSLAYYYKGTGNKNAVSAIASIILGNSLLTGQGIPVAGEYEVKNVQAMKIMSLLGAGGSFSEYYAVDFEDDVVLFGHDGPGHIAIAEGKPKVKPLSNYHGKVGNGLSIEMSVAHGQVTLLSIVEKKDSLMMLCAEGHSVPGPILEIGNTNSRYRFELDARTFIQSWNSNGPAHHCAIGVGHIGNVLNKLSLLLGVPFTKVC